MTITIKEVIQKIDDWRDRQAEIQEMTGGLTNKNYRVEVEGQSYFVRIPGASTELLAVDRDSEYHSSKAAAAAGVGRLVLVHINPLVDDDRLVRLDVARKIFPNTQIGTDLLELEF